MKIRFGDPSGSGRHVNNRWHSTQWALWLPSVCISLPIWGFPMWLALSPSANRSQNLLFRPSHPWSTRRPVCLGRPALGSVPQPRRQTLGTHCLGQRRPCRASQRPACGLRRAGCCWDSPRVVWSLLCGVATTPDSWVVPGLLSLRMCSVSSRQEPCRFHGAVRVLPAPGVRLHRGV